MSMVVVLVLAVFVMPRIEVFFKRLNAKLPLVTRMPLRVTAFDGVREAMMHGQGLSGPINLTELFPAAARQVFRVGEESGMLD